MNVTVKVPATTANLGPGFDCLGLALGLYNYVTFRTIEAGLTIEVEGEGAGRIPTDESNLVVQAAQRVFERVGKSPAGLHIHQINRIPVSSGLGSSGASVLGGMLAANVLVGGTLLQDEIVEMAVEMEGHPDNVVAAAYGGMVLIVPETTPLHIEPIPIPPMEVIIVLPDFDLSTQQARAVLPPALSRKDVVFNTGRVALLIYALMMGYQDKFKVAMQDRGHQPYRLPLVPGMEQALELAYQAGATGVALSGAGPSVMAFAQANHDYIGEMIMKGFDAAGLTSRKWVLPLDKQGAVVTF